MTSPAVAFFTAKLAFQTDVTDVHAALAAEPPGFVLVDSRSPAAWDQGHVPGAVHLPTAEIAERAAAEIGRDTPVVTYCWGPGCDGATRAALEFARRGYSVKEMIGGIEYWTREGFPVESAAGVTCAPADPLTVPCDC
jgi:rhodanese-related sulfurtransferase